MSISANAACRVVLQTAALEMRAITWFLHGDRTEGAFTSASDVLLWAAGNDRHKTKILTETGVAGVSVTHRRASRPVESPPTTARLLAFTWWLWPFCRWSLRATSFTSTPPWWKQSSASYGG